MNGLRITIETCYQYAIPIIAHMKTVNCLPDYLKLQTEFKPQSVGLLIQKLSCKSKL